MSHSTTHPHASSPSRRLRRSAGVRGLAAGLGVVVALGTAGPAVAQSALGSTTTTTSATTFGVSAGNAAALELSLAILTAEGPLRPAEFGSPWPELARFAGGFSDDDHTHHLHFARSAE